MLIEISNIIHFGFIYYLFKCCYLELLPLRYINDHIAGIKQLLQWRHSGKHFVVVKFKTFFESVKNSFIINLFPICSAPPFSGRNLFGNLWVLIICQLQWSLDLSLQIIKLLMVSLKGVWKKRAALPNFHFFYKVEEQHCLVFDPNFFSFYCFYFCI